MRHNVKVLCAVWDLIHLKECKLVHQRTSILYIGLLQKLFSTKMLNRSTSARLPITAANWLSVAKRN